MFKLDLEKAEEPEIKLPTSTGSSTEKVGEVQKNIYFFFIDYVRQRLWPCGSQQTVENLLKRWEYQTTLPASCEIYMQVKKQELEPETWHNRLVPNRERSTSRLYFVTLLIHLICREHHVTCWAGWSTAGIKITGRNINNLRYADDTTLMAESQEELKSLLMKVKEESEKVGLKHYIQKTKIIASGPITSW